MERMGCLAIPAIIPWQHCHGHVVVADSMDIPASVAALDAAEDGGERKFDIEMDKK